MFNFMKKQETGEIKISTQKEYDNIIESFSGKIIIQDTKEALYINREFKNAYQYVSDNATIESVSGNTTIESVSDNATIEYVYGNATIEYVYGNATIKNVYGNATIKNVYGNATIKNVYGNATIKNVYGNATIKNVSGSVTIKNVYDNATIKNVYGNATIKNVSGNVTILLMTGLASIVLLKSASKIIAKGLNLIRQIGIKKIDIEMSESVTFVQVEASFEETPTFDFYKKMYLVTENKKKVIMYKSVHKYEDGTYHANYNTDFLYEVGKTVEIKCSKDLSNSCLPGLHISHLEWAVRFGRGWSDMAILEVEVDPKDIIVASDCDGKVRCSKLKVLREVPKEEY